MIIFYWGNITQYLEVKAFSSNNINMKAGSDGIVLHATTLLDYSLSKSKRSCSTAHRLCNILFIFNNIAILK